MSDKTQGLVPLDEASLDIENIVARSNKLLASIESPLSVGAFKLFDTYLSLINPTNSSVTGVVIRKADYRRLLNKKQIRTEDLNKFAKELSLLQYGISGENYKGRTYLNLFEYVSVFEDSRNGEVLIGMKCTESAKPLLFDLKTVGYIKYQLKNTIALNTDYETRLYIYLSTQVFRKVWEINFYELKKRLFCEKVRKYESYAKFNAQILSNAINHINEKTNLTIEYEYLFKRGKGAGSGKIKFTVLSYEKMIFSDNLTAKKETDNEQVKSEYLSVCNNEFTAEQIFVLLDLIEHLDKEWLKSFTAKDTAENQITEYLKIKFNEMNVYNPKNRFKYLLKMIENDNTNRVDNVHTSSYDIDELEKINTLDDVK